MSISSCEGTDDEKRIRTVSPLNNVEKEQSSKEMKAEEESEEKKDESKEGEDSKDDAAEARKVTGYKACKKPSRQMVEDHRTTHMRYEAWCPDCVMGRGLGARHVESTNRTEELRVPTIAADYCFVGDEQEEQKLTILVARDSKSGGT